MSRSLHLAYALACYAIFLATFVYTAGFLLGVVVPKTIDSGPPGPVGRAIAIDLALLSLFAIQHSGMARPAFKRRWTRIVPAPIERATYVLISSGVLIAVMAYWQPISGHLWHFEAGVGRVVGMAGFALGVGLVLYSTMLIDHFELFGLRTVWARWRGAATRDDDFVTPSLYRFIRHPLYVGWFVTLWATPTMSWGHLLFAAVASGYILVAVRLEERDLIAAFGARYEDYRATTPMFVPRGRGTAEGPALARTA